jgi:hypothetical protein
VTNQPAGGGSHEIDVDRYWTLPTEVRSDFEDWMAAEGLWDQRIRWMRLLERAVEAERFCVDSGGHCYLDPTDPTTAATERLIYPIRTAPPREALT